MWKFLLVNETYVRWPLASTQINLGALGSLSPAYPIWTFGLRSKRFSCQRLIEFVNKERAIGNGQIEVLYYRPQLEKIERMSIGGLE